MAHPIQDVYQFIRKRILLILGATGEFSNFKFGTHYI